MDLNTPRMRALLSTALVITGKDLPRLFAQLPAQIDTKEIFQTTKDTVADIGAAIRRFPTTVEGNGDFKTYAGYLVDEQLKKMAMAKIGVGSFYPNYLALVKTLKGIIDRKQPTENLSSSTQAAAAAD